MRITSLTLGMLGLLTPASPAQGRIWYADGENSQDLFGSSLDVLPDLDADGLPEVLIGAYVHLCGGINPPDGAIYEFSESGAQLDEWCGTEELLGVALARLGDVDQDGVDDFALGASAWEDPTKGPATGRVHVISAKTGATIFIVQGNVADMSFGAAVAGLPDYDGDGYPELLVGAPGDSSGQGEVYVLSTKDASTLRIYSGEGSFNRFGQNVAALGDVDGDGVKDYAVHARLDLINGAQKGRVYVYSGATGAELWTVTGVNKYDELGRAISDGGDIDGDGCADVLCGGTSTPSAFDGTGHFDGYSGKTGALLFRIEGTEPGEKFGWSCDMVGDANDDGVGDYLVGAPFNSHVGVNAGRATLYSGKTLRPIYTFYPGYDYGAFGWTVRGGADFNGNGINDFVIAAPATRFKKPVGGRVGVYAGNDLYLQPDIKDPAPGEFVTFDIRGGQPGAFAELVLVDISGTPMFEPLVFDFLDVNGELSSTLCVPDEAAGLDFTFISYAQKNGRKPRWIDSGTPVISVQ